MTATAKPALATSLADLADEDAQALARWHMENAGDDDGRPWLPAAIRALPFTARLKLALDPEADTFWRELERRRVQESAAYFTAAYGHVQPPTGPPAPFALWPEQQRVMADLAAHRRVIVLKARQLGLTWLALHAAVHALAFSAATPNARILALSKHGGDATKLLARVRRIIQLLPPWLRPDELAETRMALTRLRLVGRGEMRSLAGSPEAARMETATLVILDEFAFVRHGTAAATWRAVLPTLGDQGRAIIVSTGNGPPEAPGDGQAFARLWTAARSGNSDLHPVFLPSSTHPARDAAWRADKRREFLTDEDFLAEYPETEDEALAGRLGLTVYSHAGINAAEALGRQLDALRAEGRLAPPAGEGLRLGLDWGEHTGAVVAWPLDGGGVYVPAEVVGGGVLGMTVEDTTRALVAAARACQDDDGAPPIHAACYDAAGVESMRTFRVAVERDPDLAGAFALRQAAGRALVPTTGVAFGKWKRTTVDYLRALFARTERGDRHGVIAISPTCATLLRQLRGLEVVDDGTGRVRKGDDHHPDALLAAVAPTAAAARGLPEPEPVPDAEPAAQAA